MRRAYTLVELLIVVAIMVILLVIALPVAKKVMDGDRAREGARSLSVYLQMAKARAAQTGRPCGVEFAVVQPIGDPGIYQATQMFLTEVRQPYVGDIIGARASIEDYGQNFDGPWDVTFRDSQGNVNPGVVASLQVVAGNGQSALLMRFDHSGQWFPGFTLNGAVRLWGLAGPDGAWGVAGVDDDGDGQTDEPDLEIPANGIDDDMDGKVDEKGDPQEHLWPGSDDRRAPVPQTGTAGVPFQIMLPPRRAGSPLELPTGTCIDLPFSGTGARGREFEAATNRLQLLFQPSGQVTAVYIDQLPQNPFPPLATMHLLCGEVDKIVSPTSGQWSDVSAANLADPNSVWVSIGTNGHVTTSENVPPSVFTATTTLDDYLATAREVATNREQAGGL